MTTEPSQEIATKLATQLNKIAKQLQRIACQINPRKCETCKQKLTGRNKQIYCSDNCRVKAYQKRLKEKEIAT